MRVGGCVPLVRREDQQVLVVVTFQGVGTLVSEIPVVDWGLDVGLVVGPGPNQYKLWVPICVIYLWFAYCVYLAYYYLLVTINF